MQTIAKVFHADHGVSNETLLWALSHINPAVTPENPSGFFCHTVELPEGHCDLLSALYGPDAGDAPVSDADVQFIKRSEDRPASRMVSLPKRATRLLTAIGIAAPDGSVTFFTAYGGPCAPREPGDETIATDEERKASADFWAKHALAI